MDQMSGTVPTLNITDQMSGTVPTLNITDQIPVTRHSLMASGPSPTQISDRGPDHDKYTRIKYTPVSQYMQREHISRANSEI